MLKQWAIEEKSTEAFAYDATRIHNGDIYASERKEKWIQLQAKLLQWFSKSNHKSLPTYTVAVG